MKIFVQEKKEMCPTEISLSFTQTQTTKNLEHLRASSPGVSTFETSIKAEMQLRPAVPLGIMGH